MSTTVDPWIDPDFPNVDFAAHREDVELADSIAEVDPQMHPQVVTNVVRTPEPEPEPVAVQPEPETEDGPEVFDLTGGGQGTIEKTKKGWCISIDVGVGGIQKFYGKTKTEAMINLAKGQANATVRIRELNRQVKLGPVETAEQKPTAPATITRRELSADERVALNLKFQTDATSGIDEYFKARYGVTPDQLIEKANKGDLAARQLEMESAHNTFLAACPEYYPDAEYKNYARLVAWLAKNKLNRTLTEHNRDEIVNELLARGQYTAENLEEAFTDLHDSELLIEKPRAVTPNPQPQPAEPAAATVPKGERIVSTTTRPRAGLGIRTGEVTPTTPPAPPKALSAEDFEKLPDDVIEKLIAKESERLRQGRR